MFHFILNLTIRGVELIVIIKHPGLKAQVYVVCNKTKLVGVLFEKSQVL